jgi:FKBP-type peptidyl-prolyl cis-trans isomerase SlyD
MQIEKDKVVSIEYTLTDPKGNVIDTSKGRAPLPYLHGARNIIPGLESALEGKNTGDELTVTIAPEQGYGLRNEQMVQTVARDRFQGVTDIKPGMQFQANTSQGRRPVTIVAADDKTVKVDANHPLAGMTLKFDVKIIDVRDASAEEKEHGHVHGPEGHHH